MRLGPYEVLAALGAGGMGEVHRARDTKLHRDVALKVLPRQFALDPDRLARFKLEAQVLASLNHPNIAAIYGFEESDGVQALVLELVEGPTLADRIATGPLSTPDALGVARQICDALEAAHRQGVIHRDLKPPNIKVRPDGTVKVLDFGLAKLVPGSGFDSPSSNLSQVPTITSPSATARGVIMGTAAYMSPEQARGTSVDKQTDIWAFGAVFFEMLSGRPAFSAGTFSDTIAKILEREPDWSALPTSTPRRIRDLLGRCLQKDQHRRLHEIADARIEIEEAQTAPRGRLRMIGLPAVAAAVALAVGTMVGAWWYASSSIPPSQPEPVSVLIADFQNQTADPVFDRSLESILRLALEGASFITAYDRSGVRALGAVPPETFDERTALEMAVKQGVRVVVSGAIEREESGFSLSMKAMYAVTGNMIADIRDTAPTSDQVLRVATSLATAVREALGDDMPESERRFAMETLSATSLDVVRDYATAVLAMSNAEYEEAFGYFGSAAARDRNFGLAYAGMAIASWNLDRQQDAEKYIKEAISHLDAMTERERYRTRGVFYMITRDSQQCVKEFGDLVARYPADASARNNLALCLTYLRELPRAVGEMRHVVKILPRRALYRENLALYTAYGGDFPTAEQEARTIENPSPLGLLALAFAQLGQNQLPQAAATYQAIGKMDGLGPSYQASGLGDLALYEGRFGDATRILAEGAAADLKSGDTERAANKFAALAYAQLLRRQPAAALAASDNALANSNAVSIRFLAARVLLEAGEVARARTLALGLGSELLIEPQAYGKILEGQVALKNGDAPQAIKLLTEANTLLDTWMGHFELGRAYLEAGLFTQADSEFDRCVRRRGETLALFLQEEPTYGYFPPVYYYLGRAREALKTAEFAEVYRTYLRIREEAGEDPFLAEVRRRAGR